jgi:regulator of cell morphogenesis and NO signaling
MDMPDLDPQQTVARIVLDHPECAAVFQSHRIDFCCHGDIALDAACRERGLDAAAVARSLAQAIAERRGEPADDPRALSTPALIARIITRHHEYLRKTLPFMEPLAAKVARVHGEHNPKLVELDQIVRALAVALLPHLDQEEEVLFPALMTKRRDAWVVERELSAMHEDHLAVGRLLERMRDACEAYALPEWACNSYRTLFAELSRLEDDVLTHVHLENHVLLPRFR